MNNATMFLVVVLFIGVACANVDARKLQKVSKDLLDQKPLSLPPVPSIPVPVLIPELGEAVSATRGRGIENGVAIVSKETKSGINGVGAELVITVTSTATNSKYSIGNGAASLGRPGSGATGSTYQSTYGSVTADGSNASAYSHSVAYGEARAKATAGHNGATGSGYGFGYGSTGNVSP